MTESEWNICNDLAPMVAFLRDKASHRKANLFVCAMCRLNWDLFFDDASKKHVEVVERFVDGQATEDDLFRTTYGAECPTFGYEFQPSVWRRWDMGIPSEVQKLVQMGVFTQEDLQADEPAVDPVVKRRLLAAANLAYHAGRSEVLQDPYLLRLIADLSGPAPLFLRDIFGNPFRPVTLDHAWLRWNDGAAVAIAQRIYDERRFQDLPILADALEEAGCTSGDILEHCRGPGPHVRGCWVVDLVLGKE